MDWKEESERWSEVLHRRNAARALIAGERIEELDGRATDLVKELLTNSVLGWKKWKLELRRLKSLLDDGANIKFDNYELVRVNLASFDDQLFLALDKMGPRDIRIRFAVLREISLSFSPSCLLNRGYVGNGGMPLPWLLTYLVCTGRSYFQIGNAEVSTYAWLKAFKTLRIMVTCARIMLHEHLIDPDYRILQICTLNGVLETVGQSIPEIASKNSSRFSTSFLEFMWFVSNGDGKVTLSEDNLKVPCPPEVSLSRSGYALHESSNSWCISMKLFALARNTPRLSEFLFNSVDLSLSSIVAFLNYFSTSKSNRERLLAIVTEDERVLRILLSPNGIAEICRRKERVLFELMFHQYQHKLLPVLPIMLEYLASSRTRGKKERFLETVQSCLERFEEEDFEFVEHSE